MLTRLLSNGNFNQEKVSKTIMMDPILCAKLLAFNNSPDLYIGTPQQVISKLIKRKNRYLLLDELFGNKGEEDLLIDCPNFDLGHYWSEAVSVGASTQYLHNTIDRNNSNSLAYFAGIFHNIGLIALVYLYPSEMNKILATSDSMKQQLDLEKTRLGIDHTTLGANMLNQWKICEIITSAVKYCEYPLDDMMHSGIPQMVIQAIEWRRSKAKRLTSLGKKLNKVEYQQLLQEEQRINNFASIFAYETF